jgi:hypothetical protein
MHQSSLPKSIQTLVTPRKPREQNPFFRIRGNSNEISFNVTGYWSYPALVSSKDNKLLWLSLILQGVPLPEKHRTALFRPFAVVLTKAGTDKLVRYEDFRNGHDPFPTLSWKEPVAMFPHQSIQRLTYQSLRKAEAELMALYKEAEPMFLENAILPDGFKAKYLSLIHPIVLRYLQHLAPRFFKALMTPRPSSLWDENPT